MRRRQQEVLPKSFFFSAKFIGIISLIKTTDYIQLANENLSPALFQFDANPGRARIQQVQLLCRRPRKIDDPVFSMGAPAMAEKLNSDMINNSESTVRNPGIDAEDALESAEPDVISATNPFDSMVLM